MAFASTVFWLLIVGTGVYAVWSIKQARQNQDAQAYENGQSATLIVIGTLLSVICADSILGDDPTPSNFVGSRLLATAVGLCLAGLCPEFFSKMFDAIVKVQVLPTSAEAKLIPHRSATAPDDHPSMTATITTALDTATSIRTGWKAFWNSWETQSQISALQDARRLAEATASTAEAEIKTLEVLKRRADQCSETFARVLLEEAIRDDQVIETRARLMANEARRLLATEAQAEQFMLARRKTTEAQHSLEALEVFKDLKFELGRARLRVRHKDAEFSGKTAEAAIARIAGDLAKLSQLKSDPSVWLEKRIAETEASVHQREADGEDTLETRAELTTLHKLKETVGREG